MRFKVRHSLIFGLVFVSCWGQPNSIHHVLPIYTPTILLLVTLGAAYALLTRPSRRDRERADLLLELAIGLFVALAALSLFYSRNPLFGANLLASALIKIVIFFVLLRLGRSGASSVRTFVCAVLTCAAIFSITGIILPLAIIFTGLEPIARIDTVAIGGNLDYDEMLAFYGLGFVRAATTLFDVLVPRAQSFFSEPGYLAYFLEFSIFTTLFAKVNGLLGFSGKTIGWLLRIQILALAFTLSLAGISLVALGFLLYLFGVAKVSRSKLLLAAIAAGCATIIVSIPAASLLSGNPIVQALVLERFSNEWGDSSVDTRTAAFGLGVELVRRNLLTGVGFGQVRIELDGQGLNNSALTMAAEFGLIGAFLYALFVLAIFAGLLHLRRLERLHRHPGAAPEATSALVSMFAVLSLHALFIDVTWTFINWLAITLIFMHRQAMLKMIKLHRQP